jgi:putative oxidoreductase
MLKKLLQTDDDVVVLILRLLLGIVFFPHGMQKLFGWFGGYGFEGTMGFFTGKLGIPALFAFLAIMAEGLGCLGLIAGLGTRIAAFGIMANMVVASFLLHAPNSIVMSWFVNNQNGMGLEYHILVIAITIALMVRGGGKWSVDRLIAKRGTVEGRNAS